MVTFSFFLFLYIISKSKIINENDSSSIEIYSNPKRKNLLIGVFTDYQWEIVAPFFKSFERANFENCDLVIFYANVSQSTINIIKSYGVIVYEIPNKFRGMNIINYRWKIFEDYLKDNKDNYNLVFTADLKDVFFQKDVFKYYNFSKPFLGIPLEDGKIVDSTPNKIWLINIYGENLYKTIENETIICAGTIWGTSNKFLDFSRVMWEKLNYEWSLGVDAVDQAVANYLIYHDKMFNDCLVKSDNEKGPVMTIALTKREDIKLDSNNNVLNRRGEIAAVIHQYNRKPDIVEKVINKYCIEIRYYKINNINNYDCLCKCWKYLIYFFAIFFAFISLILIIIFLSKFQYQSLFKFRKINKSNN